MKINNLICAIFALSLVSCAEDLTPSDDSLLTQRYLNNITEVLSPISYYPSGMTTSLFSKPKYENRQIVSGYCNFTGWDANHIYTFQDDKIILEILAKDGDERKMEYTLVNNYIHSCNCTTIEKGESRFFSFNYEYDDIGRLINITGNPYGSPYCVNIQWENNNIEQIFVSMGGNYTEVYTYEYDNRKHKDNLPMFHLSCIYVGGIMGVDEILALEGYFGIVSPSSVPVREYFSGRLSRVFDYAIDKKGFISNIKQINEKNNKVIRKYNIDWK